MSHGLSFSQTAKADSKRVLLIDENRDDCALMTLLLTSKLPEVDVICADHEDSLEQALEKRNLVAVVTEYRLGWTDAFHVLDTVRRLLPRCPVVMFTGSGNEDLVCRALKNGFADYVAKSAKGYLRLVRRIQEYGQSPTAVRQEIGLPEQSPVQDQSIELLHAVSHDLQEPLRGISRFSRLVEEKLTEADQDMKRYMRHVIEASDRMHNMLEDYLEYLNAGTDKDKGENTDLEAALDSAIGNLEARVEESGAAIKRGSLPSVGAGLNDMVRLFQNLLENALKFCSEAAPQIEVAAQRMQTAWLVSVRDNGIGIDPADFQRVFQMHRRLHPAREYPGNGMGLAICKRIVEGYGGRIWLDSQPGVGSTFYVTLPTANEPISEETFETA